MIKVYISDTDFLKEKEAFDAAYNSMPAWRKRKVDEMKHSSGKTLALGAGVLLHKALQDIGVTEEPQEASVNEYGKPFYKEYPYLHFSLSHSGTKVMCVISDTPVGCDVEQIKKRDQDIAKRFFAKDEYELIQSQPSEQEQTKMFFHIWTQKESYIKCIGTGLSTELNSFSVLNLPDYKFQEFEKSDGYCYSVCQHC